VVEMPTSSNFALAVLRIGKFIKPLGI